MGNTRKTLGDRCYPKNNSVATNSASTAKIVTEIWEEKTLQTLRGTIHQGHIELLDSIELPEGANVLVTLLPDEETEFWQQTSQSTLDTVWDNPEDEIYAELLQK
jgi:hypothetical protein